MEALHAAQKKRRECLIQSKAYSQTLGALGPANFVLVVGAALLSLVAGATILSAEELISEFTSGVLALISAALTVIHTKLGCEQYQGECRKLMAVYGGLAEDYNNLQFASAYDLPRRFMSLNDQLSTAVKNATARPYDWAVRKAVAATNAQQ
jgi:hypothetical protein